jgi:ferredoxin--NADP+ reductase
MNELVPGEGVEIVCRPTAYTEELAAGLVFRSVGYKGVELPGVPFDARTGLIPNDKGRVLDADSGSRVPGLYVTGWIKRGPTGVIGTNKKDATETVERLLEDARAGRLPSRGEGSIDALLASRGVDVVTYAGWEAIDRVERERGEAQGRPRVKLCRWEELLEVGTVRAE